MRTSLVLFVFAVVYLSLQVGTHRAQSATFDEPVHLTAGYVAVTRGDFAFDISHPPLLRMWAALPLLLDPPRPVDLSRRAELALPQWSDQINAIGYDFIYGTPGSDRMLERARFMISLLGVALGILVFFWTRHLLGEATAIATLGLYLIAPNLAAHAGLVTTDLGLTLFYFGTAYFLWRLQRGFTRWSVAGVCLCFALALVSKFSAVILFPIIALVVGVSAARKSAITWRRAGAVVLLAAAAGYVGIWAAYGFRYALPPDLGPVRVDLVPEVQATPGLVIPTLGWMDAHRILPAAYCQGFIWCLVSATNLVAYLAGEVRTGGWWYYFPAALVLKSSVAKLALVAAGFVLIVRRREVFGRDVLTLIVPPAVYLAAAMMSDLNIGVRHVLPVAPFALVIAGVAVRELLNRGRVARAGLAAAATLWVVGFAAAYPYPLTYFNLAVGGSTRGSRFLADSNLDWGQGLKALQRWVRENNAGRVNLAYFGPCNPEDFGMTVVQLPTDPDFVGSGPPELPGYVVLSPTVLALSRRDPRLELLYAGFQNLEPAAIVGNALRVYRLEEWPAPPPPSPGDPARLLARLALADTLFGKLGWTEQAVRLYRDYLSVRPRDSKAMASLGLMMLQSGSTDQALTEFARAVPADPEPEKLAEQIEMVLLKERRAGSIGEFRRRVRTVIR